MHKKKLAGLLFPRYSRILDIVNRNALLMDWIRKYRGIRVFQDRIDYYSYINDEVLKQRRIDYLEFGVYQGASISHWSRINSDPGSRFWGFDTFEGLLEDWHWAIRGLPKGHFSTLGRTPAIEDTRVQFIKGLFQETMDGFLAGYKPSGTLVINMDPDLYSSTLYVLTKLDAYIARGAIVLFDEFSSVLNEFRAFDDYVKSYRRSFKPIAAVTETLDRHAIAIGADDGVIEKVLRDVVPTGGRGAASSSA